MGTQESGNERGRTAGGFRPVHRMRVRRLFTSSGPAWQTCSLRYDPDAPYSVLVALHQLWRAPVRWELSRDLLAQAAHGPRGAGTYRIWPSRRSFASSRPRLYFSFQTPAERVTFEADRAEVLDWLDGTFARVPRGTESDRLDWDGLEGKLLGRL
ncbi:SsgA family sporulation/cell division regulator [Streptomyces fumanus]|uniref:SsgA family sporulation/cell division regulator n=1 Tax=Streptomyces fumanus TaxID=67302 RepID=A0A919ALC7_9ACTN|nr:SsgA family sporulation/cell division regulator [Streptomyces fumanus]GHF11360.1 hypothetical protein GCM10018772_40560 [Streptomyces fumanus]